LHGKRIEVEEPEVTLNVYRGPRLLVDALCAVVAFKDQQSHEVRAHPAFAILTYTAHDPSTVTVEVISWRRLQFCWHLDRHLVSRLAANRGDHAPKQAQLHQPGEPDGPRLIVDAEQLGKFLADADALEMPGTEPAACAANTDPGVLSRHR
jgi:hypothetical protein